MAKINPNNIEIKYIEAKPVNSIREDAISGVILAGGAGSRFGGLAKPNIRVDGERIISRIIRTIEDLFSEIIIVTNTPSEFQDLSWYMTVGDHFQNAGPLAGIHSGLKSSENDSIFVFAGDMPFLNKDIIAEQIRQFRLNESEILIPMIGELIEPLHSIYRISVLERMERFLAEGKNRSVRDFLSGLHVDYFILQDSEENRRAFTNINTQGDIDSIK